MIEDVLEGVRDNTPQRRRVGPPFHGVRLARPCLTVREDRTIISIKAAIYYASCARIVNELLLDIRSKYVIEAEIFRTLTMCNDMQMRT